MPRVQIIGVVNFIFADSGANNHVSRLLLRGCAVRTTGLLCGRPSGARRMLGGRFVGFPQLRGLLRGSPITKLKRSSLRAIHNRFDVSGECRQ
jgi:hypothetical protein